MAYPEYNNYTVEFEYDDYARAGVEKPGEQLEYVYERAGVTHLVHCWRQQGQGNKCIMPLLLNINDFLERNFYALKRYQSNL
jgi:hypothetical protein